MPCGDLNRAVATRRELLETFGRDLDTVTLRTSHGGVFKIRIDSRPVFHAKQAGDPRWAPSAAWSPTGWQPEPRRGAAG